VQSERENGEQRSKDREHDSLLPYPPERHPDRLSSCSTNVTFVKLTCQPSSFEPSWSGESVQNRLANP